MKKRFAVKLAVIAIDHATHFGPCQKFGRVKPSEDLDPNLKVFVQNDSCVGNFVIQFPTHNRLHGLFEVRDHENRRILGNSQVRGIFASQHGIILLPLGQVLRYMVQKKALLISNTCHPVNGSWLEFDKTSNTDCVEQCILRRLREAYLTQQRLIAS